VIIRVERTDRRAVRAVETDALKQSRDKTGAPERSDESESQRHASKISRQTGERGQDIAHPARRAGRGGGIGHKKAENTADQGGGQAYPNAGKVGLQGKGVFQERKIGQGKPAFGILKSPGKQRQRRHDQKKSDEKKKGQQTNPGFPACLTFSMYAFVLSGNHPFSSQGIFEFNA
jgi:hypothetical protein